MINREKMGTWGWVGLATFVVAFDYLSDETMSSAADRYLDNRVGKYIAPVVGGMVVGHVFNIYEHFGVKHLDPIQLLGDKLFEVKQSLDSVEEHYIQR